MTSRERGANGPCGRRPSVPVSYPTPAGPVKQGRHDRRKRTTPADTWPEWADCFTVGLGDGPDFEGYSTLAAEMASGEWEG